MGLNLEGNGDALRISHGLCCCTNRKKHPIQALPYRNPSKGDSNLVFAALLSRGRTYDCDMRPGGPALCIFIRQLCKRLHSLRPGCRGTVLGSVALPNNVRRRTAVVVCFGQWPRKNHLRAGTRASNCRRECSSHGKERAPAARIAPKPSAWADSTKTADPPAAGAFIQLLIDTPEGEMRARAVIRNADPGRGMGVEFVGMDQAARTHLHSLLKRLLPGSA